MAAVDSIPVEIMKVALAGMGGESELKTAVAPLAEKLGVSVDPVTPEEVAKELIQLNIERSQGSITDEIRDQRLKIIIGRALTAKNAVAAPAAV